MDTPSLLAREVGDDPVEAAVPLGGEDRLVVTPSRTLVYRAEGLLRDESVESIAHDVDRVAVTEGRRKTTVTATDATGDEEFTVPTNRLDDVLAPLLGGVLTAAGATADGEAVVAVYRFSELTLVVTEARVVKHVGTALWDAEYESYPFEAVTDLDAEEGSVATQLVLTVDGRPQRIKTPREQAGEVHQTLERALFDYHGVDSVAALRTRAAERAEAEADGDSDADDADGPAAADETTDGRTVEPLLTDESEGAETAARRRADEASPAAPMGDGVDDATVRDDEVLRRLDTLEATVDHQTELIERQRETLELLVEELRQGR